MTETERTFRDFEQFVTAYDPISLLSQLTLTFLFVPEDQFQAESSDVFQWQRRIEFVAAYVLARPHPSQGAQPDGETLGQVEKLVDRYFNALQLEMLFSDNSTGSLEKDMILNQAKIESLYVRGDAYPHQFYEFARDLYGPHDKWFLQHLGFTIGDAIAMAKSIDREYGKRFNCSRDAARDEARRQANRLIIEKKAGQNQRAELESQIACALFFGDADEILTFTATELASFSGIPLQTVEHFLDRMSQEFGYRNPNFPASFTDPASAAWDYNTLNERPLVRHDGRHWLFVAPVFHSAVFSTFYFDLRSDAEYLPKFEKTRGEFLETKTAEYLRRVFPSDAVLLNPCYPSGDELADAMVLYDRKVLIFQCKSKSLTYRARTGSDFEALRNDVRKAISDAFKQGVRAKNYLQTNRRAKLYIGESGFEIDMDQVNGMYVVNVTAMPFRNFTGRLANTSSVLELFQENEYPWSICLGDLDIVTQILLSPARFLHYIIRRQQVERTPFQVAADEMDYLGFYLSHGMRFELSDVDTEGMDRVALSGFSDEIDRWVFEKFELGKDSRKPRSDEPDGFENLVADVERTGDSYATDCVIALLDLTWAGRKALLEMIGQTSSASRQDKSLHSFSIVLKGGKRGFSYVIFDAQEDMFRLYRQAASFAMLRKYKSQCDEWIGLGVGSNSTRTVDVAFFISQPWAYDEKMEQLVKINLRPGRQVAPGVVG